MRYVQQTILAGRGCTPKTTGNCLQAAIASVLNLSLDEVPHFAAIKGNWWDEFREWLWRRGLDVVYLQFSAIEKMPPVGPYIVNGVSPRGYGHSVVYLNGHLEHDPHPAGGGVKPQTVYLFTLTNSALAPALALEKESA